MTKKEKRLLALLIIFFVIISITLTFIIRENILRRAKYTGDGMLYVEINFTEIPPYKETYNTVCKKIDGVRVLYEIEQYPDHEYLVARCGLDACVVKRVR